jgi:DnaJ family protein A protein 2
MSQGLSLEEARKILGLETSADEKQIKSAYKKLAFIHHPDKGGDPEQFKRIGQAYHRLTHPEESSVIEGGMPFDIDPSKLFETLFGGIWGGGFQPPQQERDVIHRKTIKLTPRDIYQGCVKEIPIEITESCEDCHSSGRAGGVKCSECHGTGMRIERHIVGPGMMFQGTVQCRVCSGGFVGEGSDRPCESCKGRGTKIRKETRHLQFEKGIPRNTELSISTGQGQNIRPNRLIVQYEETHDEWFGWVLEGRNLKRLLEISLKEALIGVNQVVRHPSGALLRFRVKSPIQPNEERPLVGQGLPESKIAGLEAGNGMIQFKIVIPEIAESIKPRIEKLMDIIINTRDESAETPEDA